MKLAGHDAINYAEANNLTLNCYANEVDGPDGRTEVTPAEARKIAKEDPSLIWIDADMNYLANYAAPPSADRFREIDAKELAAIIAEIRQLDPHGERNDDLADATRAAELMDSEGAAILHATDEDGHYFAVGAPKRYRVYPVSSALTELDTSNMIVATDDFGEAKAYASGYHRLWGAAIVDRETSTIDWGHAVTPIGEPAPEVRS